MVDNNPEQKVIPPGGPNPNSTTGLRENIAAMLCYIFPPAPWIGGIVMFLLEPGRKFVRFHAAQSIIVFGLLTIIAIVFRPLVYTIPYLGYVLSSLFGLFWFILWLVLVVKAYQGLEWKLPVLGDVAARWASR